MQQIKTRIHTSTSLLAFVAILIAAPGVAHGQYCELYAEAFDSFSGPRDSDNGTFRVEWCVNGATVTTSNPCPTGNSLRLSSSSEDPIVWVFVDSQGCTNVRLEFDYGQFSDSFTDVKYLISGDTTLNCSASIITSAGYLTATGGVCTHATLTLPVSSAQSVYFKFDHGFNSNAIFLDNVQVFLETCDCTGGGASHDCCEAGGPGCDDPVVESCVCAQDPYCCDTAWDEQCVSEVDSFGCGNCGGGCDTEFAADFGTSFQSGSVCSLWPELFDTCEGNGPYITSGTDCGGAGDYAMSFATGYPYSAAITKCLDLSGVAAAHLDFSYTKDDGTLGPRIDVSTDGGSGFTTVWTASSSFPGGCLDECLDLADYVGQADVRLRFSSGSSASNGAAFDDILFVPGSACGGGGNHDCCETGEAGCDDAGVESCVCATDPYCCSGEWDGQCVLAVEALGCGDCGGACLTDFSTDFGDTFQSGSVCEIYPLLLIFETCAGDGPYLSSGTACGGADDYCMVFGTGYPYSETTLRCIDLTGVTEASLQFNYTKADGTLGPELYASLNGTDWTNIWTAPFGFGGGCVPECVDLGDYAGEPLFYLKFSSGTLSTSQAHAIDDIQLVRGTGCPACEDPTAEAGPGMELCPGMDVVLDGSATGGSGGLCPGDYSPSWAGPGIVSGGDTFNPVVNATGIYTLTVSCDTCQDQDTVEVTAMSVTLGDVDCDGDVDLADFSAFADCMDGPEIPFDAGCGVFDWDQEGDVDLPDFAAFQRAFTGPSE